MLGCFGLMLIVVGDCIYFMVVLKDDMLEVWVFDFVSGDVVWKCLFGGGNFFCMKYNMLLLFVVSDGEKVWFMVGMGVIKVFDCVGMEFWVWDF